MRWTSVIVVAALLVITHGPSFGRTYVVSTAGNDGNAGTLASPWRTLARASSGLQAGDTVLVRAGTYHERFIPTNSGTSGNPIVYKNYPGERPEIDGSPSGGLNVIAVYQHYIVIEGFLVTNQNNFKLLGNPTYWVSLDGNYITFRYNRVISPGDVFDNIYVKNAISRGVVVGGNHSVVEHCYVRGQVFGIVVVGPSPRHVVLRYDTVHATGQNNIDNGGTDDGSTAYHSTLIEHCDLDTSFIEDNIQFEVDYGDPTSVLHNRGTIVRYNRMGNAAENAIDLKGAGHTIIEHNLIYTSTGDDDGPIGGHDAGSGSGVTSNPNNPTRYTIIRSNVIWDHSSAMEMAEGDHVFQNTILNNRRTWQGPNQTDAARTGIRAWNYPDYNRAVLNNIIGAQPNVGVYDFLMDWGDKFDLNNNLYFDTGAQTKFYHRMNNNRVTTTGLAAWKNVLATHGGYAYMKGKDAASIEANPQFVNAPAYPAGYDESWDFGLTSGSPAIDAGGALTAATSSGTNATALTVEDAYFFCDGFDIVDGDSIRIGGGTPVQITAIDYARNIITLAAARTWATGDAVNLTYNGNAPDIGAFESGQSAPIVPPPTPPAQVPLSAPADGATGIASPAVLSWSPVATASSYAVQVSTSSSFSSFIADVNGIIGTTYTITSLNAGTVYYWRARAANQAGPGSWSAVRSFTTAVAVPATAQLAAPANGATEIALAPALSWNAVTGALTYEVQVSQSSAFTSFVANQTGLTGTSYALASLAQNTVYYWRVRATNSGGAGGWSTSRSFTTLVQTDGGVTPAPQLLLNNDFESGTQNWSFQTGGTGRFAVEGPGLTGNTAAHVTITTTGGTIQLYQQGITLQAATQYKLTVSGYSNTGHAMAVAVFKHGSPFTNYGLSPKNIAMQKSWRTRTIYFKTANFTGTVNDARLQFAFQTSASAGDQYWLDGVSLQRVTAVPSPIAPSLLGPAAGETGQPVQPFLRWSESDAADVYNVQLALDAGFTTSVLDTVVADTLIQPHTLLYETQYFCRVRAQNLGGFGTFSNTVAFTTMPAETIPEKQSTLPAEIQLDQNYPNPFNPATAIRYRLTGTMFVRLTVYNALGAVVAVLADGVQEKGEHSVTFTADRLPSGVYFCRLHAEGVIETRKMLLVR
jgi:hypothetical protein